MCKAATTNTCLETYLASAQKSAESFAQLMKSGIRHVRKLRCEWIGRWAVGATWLFLRVPTFHQKYVTHVPTDTSSGTVRQNARPGLQCRNPTYRCSSTIVLWFVVGTQPCTVVEEYLRFRWYL